MKKEAYLKIVTGISILLVLLMMFVGFSDKRDRNKAIQDVIEYQHTVSTYAAKDGTLVEYNKALQTELEILELLNDSLVGYIDNIKIKDPEVVTLIDINTEIDSIFIPVPIPCDSTFSLGFLKEDSSFKISGSVSSAGLNINNISFPNRIGVTIGTKRNGIFKKNETIVAVTNSNPHVSVKGTSSYTFIEDKKWWEKGLTKFIVGGIVGGAAIYFVTK